MDGLVTCLIFCHKNFVKFYQKILIFFVYYLQNCTIKLKLNEILPNDLIQTHASKKIRKSYQATIFCLSGIA